MIHNAHFNFLSCQVYIPLLSAHQMKMTSAGCQSREVSAQEETSEKISPVKSKGQFTVRDELLNRTYKFLGVVNTTLQQLQTQGLL